MIHSHGTPNSPALSLPTAWRLPFSSKTLTDVKEVPTELEAIVSQIQLLTESQQIPPVPQPWLPPLKERMTLQELEPIQPQEAWEQKKPVSVLLGMADIPQAQKQEPVSVNLSKDGHILLYGSPGTGKTTFLQSAAMDLARKFSPKDITLYLMDFGTNGSIGIIAAPSSTTPPPALGCGRIPTRRSRTS